MHLCEHCRRELAGCAQQCLGWVLGQCQKCQRVACVTCVALASLCPVLEHHPHAPEANSVQRGTVENPPPARNGAITSGTIARPLVEEYQFVPPSSSRQSAYRRYSPPDEAGL